jgi:hypothetical protein
MTMTSNLSLVGSLLVVGGCGGFIRSLNADQSPSTPAPTKTFQLDPVTPAGDGASYYTKRSYSYDRGSSKGSVPVSVQLVCPKDQHISGFCGVSRKFADGRTEPSASAFQSICFDPSTSMERGFEACQVGALFCGTTLNKEYEATGEDPYLPEAVGATFVFSARCVPTHPSRP